MRGLALAALSALLAALPLPAQAFAVLHWEGRQGDLLSNGGFEEAGTPPDLAAGWIGYTERKEPARAAVVELTPDAHSGSRAVRLMAEGTNLVGLNRTYRAGEDAGAMVPLARGWMEFWYRAVSSATGENLRVYAIAMPTDGVRERGRSAYVVPTDHIADGQWHRGTVHFDFSSDAQVKYVQIAPRINEGGEPGSGEFLLDDVAVYPAGPDVAVEVGGFSASLARVGDTVRLRGRLRNLGDAPASTLRAGVALDGPAQLLGPAEMTVPAIPAAAQGEVAWDVRLTGAGPVTARVTLGGGDYGRTDWPAVMVASTTLARAGATVCRTPTARLRYVAQDEAWGTLLLDAAPNAPGEYRRAATLPFLGWAVVGPERDILVFPVRRPGGSRAALLGYARDSHDNQWELAATVSEGAGGSLRWQARLRGPSAPVYHFASPWVLLDADAGKTEACLPGLEYLTAEEASSNELDGKYPLSLRWAPHVNKVTLPFLSVSYGWGTTGLAWDPLAAWDDDNDRPQPLFATPNRLGDQDNSLLALAVPGTMQGRGENQLEATTPHEKGTGDLFLDAELFFTAGSSTDAALAWYLDTRGLPPDPPLPRSVEEGYRLCLDSSENRWVEQSAGWYATSAWSRGAGPSPFLARALWLDGLLTTDEARRTLWRSRVQATTQALGGRVGLSTGLWVGDLWSALVQASGEVRGLLASQQERGGWGFGGNDTWDLGEVGKAVSGTTARNAVVLLSYAAATGDETALAAGLKALTFCNEYDPIPRGGQTWEVPLHTPDIIVAGQALHGHVLAYQLTGDPAWIEMGRHWAYATLPFIYLWRAPERPIMPYATIPVLGTSAWVNPWYGRPVQWCGIAVIRPLQKFAEYDRTEDWAALAHRLVIASMQQQLDFDKRVYPDTKATPEDRLYWWYPSEDLDRCIGLYPDNFRLFGDKDFCWGYMISPNSHYPLTEALMHELGLPAGERTVVVRTPEGPMHVTAPLPIRQVGYDDGRLTVQLDNPQAWPVRVLLARVSRPSGVTANGAEVPMAAYLDPGETLWNYQPTGSLCVVQSSAQLIILAGVSPQVPQQTGAADLTAWEFDAPGDAQGFLPEHDISVFAVEDGRLLLRTSGADPWFSIHGLALDADRFRTLKIRISALAEASSSLEVFFAPAGEGTAQGRAVSVPLVCGGQMHELILPVGSHPAWQGRISTIRLDPTHGLGPADVEIDWIRFE